MINAMGVINLANEQDSLNELTYFRNLASIPFGGRYRLIDFALSNMVNSGISDIAVFPVHKYRSLMEHLGTGRDWDLDRKRGGLFVLPPVNHMSTKLGDIHNLYQHLDFFIHGAQKYVVISGGNLVSNIDYRPALDFHRQAGADITLIYKEYQDTATDNQLKRIKVDKLGRVTMFEKQHSQLNSNNVFMEIIIMEKELLLNIIKDCPNRGSYNLIENGIIPNIANLKIYGYPYFGFLASINSVLDYYKNSMKLLNDEAWKELFYQPRPIYTKGKNDPPSKYNEKARTHNSLIANGCIIEGNVENSILFRGVKIAKGAEVINSIIMQKSEVGEKSIVVNSIIDKKVIITPNKNITGEKNNPLVIAKRMVI